MMLFAELIAYKSVRTRLELYGSRYSVPNSLKASSGAGSSAGEEGVLQGKFRYDGM